MLALFVANANPPPMQRITMKINADKELLFLIPITSMIQAPE
jgi:hypothetical protein